MIKSRRFSVLVFPLGLALAGCVSLGGDEVPVANALATDTYDNCGIAGSTLLSSSGGAVRLGMTECELVKVLGDPSAVGPDVSGGGQRRITLTYASQEGGSTAYLFVDNALKEINQVEPAPIQPPG